MRERIFSDTGEFASGVLSFLLIDIDLGKTLVDTKNPDLRKVAHLSIKKILSIAGG